MRGKIFKAIQRRRAPQPVRRRAVDLDASKNNPEAESSSDYIFRRNRTLTGSLLSSVSSPSERHADLKSPRVQVHELRRHRRRLTVALLGVIVVLCVGVWLLFQSIITPVVSFVGVISPDSATTERYEQAVQGYLSAHPGERLRATVNTKTLTEFLQQNNYPEVQNVLTDVTSDGFGRANFSIVLRQPVVSWQTGSSLVYVDSEGVTFSRDVYNESVVQVKDETGVQATTDQVLVSNRFLEFIGKTVGYFKAQNYTVNSVVLPQDTTHQLQVVLDGVSYSIKLSIDRPAAGQVEDATRAIRYLANNSITPEYLDVRVSGRAFYK